MEADKRGQELTLLLNDAADEKPGAAAAFFEALLRSDVFVPLKDRPPQNGAGPATPGKGEGAEKFASVTYEGNECIPIFTEESFVEQWAEREISCEARPFKTLLWLLDDETWLYLNANQELGKELTAWEISLLRKGEEAIPELIAALGDDQFTEIEVRSDRDVYSDLKEKILPILEIYPELEECFVVAVKEGGSEMEKPMIGLRWAGANEGKKQYIRSELDEVGREYMKHTGGVIIIFDDLDNPDSPNHTIFSDATPIYFRKPFGKEPLLSRMKTAILGRFTKSK